MEPTGIQRAISESGAVGNDREAVTRRPLRRNRAEIAHRDAIELQSILIEIEIAGRRIAVEHGEAHGNLLETAAKRVDDGGAKPTLSADGSWIRTEITFVQAAGG